MFLVCWKEEHNSVNTWLFGAQIRVWLHVDINVHGHEMCVSVCMSRERTREREREREREIVWVWGERDVLWMQQFVLDEG